jgi:biopolymer transport protein TolQ
MSADMSFFHLVAGASVVVQLVMLLLLAVSVASWTMIFRRRKALRDAREAADAFEDRFWSGGDMATLFRDLSKRPDNGIGMSGIFQAGFNEFLRLRKQSHVDPRTVVESTQRVMHVVLSRETDDLETHLSFLGNAQHATLSMVAPGIAEALIATAMGLFAAIPAVIAYNRYSNDVERLINRYDNFLEEFSTILQRQLHTDMGERGRRWTDNP